MHSLMTSVDTHSAQILYYVCNDSCQFCSSTVFIQTRCYNDAGVEPHVHHRAIALRAGEPVVVCMMLHSYHIMLLVFYILWNHWDVFWRADLFIVACMVCVCEVLRYVFVSVLCFYNFPYVLLCDLYFMLYSYIVDM